AGSVNCAQSGVNAVSAHIASPAAGNPVASGTTVTITATAWKDAVGGTSCQNVELDFLITSGPNHDMFWANNANTAQNNHVTGASGTTPFTYTDNNALPVGGFTDNDDFVVWADEGFDNNTL